MNNLEIQKFYLYNLSILLIDNDSKQIEILKYFIESHGGICHPVDNISDAINYIETQQFDVVICDLLLDDGSTAFDFIDRTKIIDPPLTIVLTTEQEIEHFLDKIVKKEIYAFLSKPYDLTTLGLLLLQASRNTKNLRKNLYFTNNLKNKIMLIQKEKDRFFFNTLTSLINALEQKDEYTKNHSETVGKICEKIGKEYTDNEYFVEDISIAGRLHDIGKIGVKDEILLKKGKLSDEEYEEIKKHPEMSYKIIKPVDNVGKISEYVLHHHERWNGKGYPHKLKAEAIPVGARILAVADTYNALVSNRPYRSAKNSEFALEVLFNGKTIEFDPEIVEIFYKLMRFKKLEDI